MSTANMFVQKNLNRSPPMHDIVMILYLGMEFNSKKM